MIFTHITDDLQIAWSPERRSLGEWQRWPRPDGGFHWHFMGWLYDGRVTDRELAFEFTNRFVRQSLGRAS